MKVLIFSPLYPILYVLMGCIPPWRPLLLKCCQTLDITLGPIGFKWEFPKLIHAIKVCAYYLPG